MLRKSLPSLASLLPFEAAARLESFTRAAEELNLTQAAVSRQIRALEQDLGTPLFERRNRAVHLTETGRDFGRAVTAGLESISSQAARIRGRQRDGEVVLFCQLCEGLYWVMPRLAQFHQKHPGVEVRVSASARPVTEQPDYFDVALQTTSRASGSHPRVFSASDDVFPVCSPAYLERHPIEPEVTTLPQHHLLHHRAHPQDWMEWDDWLAALDLPFRVGDKGSRFDSYPMMIEAAIEGHGITLGWQRTMERLLDSGALVRPFAESVLLPEGLSVYKRQDGPTRPEAKALIEWLRAELAN